MLDPPEKDAVMAFFESTSVAGQLLLPNTHITNAGEDCPPHEMSYLTIKRLQYGGSRAQDSCDARPHIPALVWMNVW
jgi:hypothetical protein